MKLSDETDVFICIHAYKCLPINLWIPSTLTSVFAEAVHSNFVHLHSDPSATPPKSFGTDVYTTHPVPRQVAELSEVLVPRMKWDKRYAFRYTSRLIFRSYQVHLKTSRYARFSRNPHLSPISPNATFSTLTSTLTNEHRELRQ